ncbi:MAG: hypothetical protein HRU31_18130 [Rhodobacteraceae bacterium]|nr:hypothetical protein [Paracoccaceae bacterium]
MRGFVMLALIWMAAPLAALSPNDVSARGFGTMTCLFHERCVIGQPFERAWHQRIWYTHDAEQLAYGHFDDGRLRKAQVMLDARWGEVSGARAIPAPLREAVASHPTVFDGDDAIYSIQYAGSPGLGQFLRGSCDISQPEN